MGTVQGPGSGCVCPESAFLKAVLNHLVLQRRQVVVVDMDAGLEHLGRGTARGVDSFIVVVEPGRKSIETATRIQELAAGLGIQRVVAVGNKIRGDEDRAFVASELNGLQVLGWMMYNTAAIECDMHGFSLWENDVQFQREIRTIGANLVEENNHEQGRR